MEVATFLAPLAIKGGVKAVKIIRVKRNGNEAGASAGSEYEPLHVQANLQQLTAEYGYIPRIQSNQVPLQPEYQRYYY